MAGRREPLAVLRAAVDRYGMIQAGDTVCVGVSGGKDSVALLALLSQLRRFYPQPFTLHAVTLDPCFDGEQTDYTAVAALCERLEVPYTVRRTQLWEAVKETLGEQNPCSLCARLRRGALHRTAVELGCNVVALGHHQDDAAETLLMSLLSGATLECFSPKSYLDRRELTLIRPLVFLKEREIAAYVRREALPVVASRCPVDGCTNRQQMKELIASLTPQYGDVADKITQAMQKTGLNGWGVE
ncbi:MAG: tRNA 2-thiocytidine biosynthesis protein TtcA [Clostridia bacterium]|nr:tRNA 2-thiocytidine biosynthesis protein TtcA [Clostridia bacterium]